MSFTDVHPLFKSGQTMGSGGNVLTTKAIKSRVLFFFGVAASLQLISLSEPATSVYTHFPYDLKLTDL